MAKVGQALGQGILLERRRDNNVSGLLEFAIRALMVGNPLLAHAPDGDHPAEDVEAENTGWHEMKSYWLLAIGYWLLAIG